MRLRWIHVGFAALATASALVSVIEGCSSSNSPAAPPPGLSQCPATLAEANGAACQSGLLCPYLFACSAFNQQTTCSCVGGAMACVTDATDAGVKPGATPVCTTLPGAATCPANEPANLIPCGTIGLVCEYDDIVCPDAAAPNIDTCLCQGGDDGGLVYNCVVTECTPSEAGVGTLPDSGEDAAAADAGDAGESDASQDAGDEAG